MVFNSRPIGNAKPDEVTRQPAADRCPSQNVCVRHSSSRSMWCIITACCYGRNDKNAAAASPFALMDEQNQASCHRVVHDRNRPLVGVSTKNSRCDREVYATRHGYAKTIAHAIPHSLQPCSWPSYHKDTPPHTFRTTATGMACLSVHQSATVYRIMATTRLVIIKPLRTSRWGPCDPDSDSMASG